ncbi:MBL fold metallo-hydrolase [Ilyobacter polytropus]|uniref:Metallo-beta-lactamase n=1 Tax=Ilyobacter polytropus (strain ATCC 51220 / DSM 2926 / LMG 16218 / CuHBu1) TaxID=572544 RepID=E3H9M5_ILYPC|nr:MBL fold metallo-hydrolase [Ilyobacter polytropus]ADO83414.1 metallo-beta-lactamase [Ilyobacter polytropus DSM 2926]
MYKILKKVIFSIITAVTIFSYVSEIAMASEPPADIMKLLHNNNPLEPTKVFDDLYCVGSVSVVAWVLKTSDGIILIDSMWDDHDAETIINGMESLGLDPSEIKYILISHGHGDHYGGANYLRDKFGAKVVMTKVDAEFMYSLTTGPNSSRSPKPPVDIYVKNGDEITLGDKTVKILETPGHTPGGISFIFHIVNDGKEHTAVLWGGTGIPRNAKEKLTYKTSVTHFEKESKEAGATIELTAHLFVGDGFKNLDTARNRKKGEANPFILGKSGMDDYFKALNKSIDDAILVK